MATGASRHWLASADGPSSGTQNDDAGARPPEELEAERLARRVADLAWAGLRSVHRD
jgi:hypothetical protein